MEDRLLKGWKPSGGDANFRNHLDGFNQLDYLTGKTPKSARTEFAYFDDDGELVGYRYNDWKAVFMEQKKPGGFPVWYEPLTVRAGGCRLQPVRPVAIENAYLMGEMT